MKFHCAILAFLISFFQNKVFLTFFESYLDAENTKTAKKILCKEPQTQFYDFHLFLLLKYDFRRHFSQFGPKGGWDKVEITAFHPQRSLAYDGITLLQGFTNFETGTAKADFRDVNLFTPLQPPVTTVINQPDPH